MRFDCERALNRKCSCRRSQLVMDRPAEKAWRPPRACDVYWSEFRHCRSFSNIFHHYYAYGTTPSCQQWKEDYHNCQEWENHRSKDTKEALQKSERKREAEQKNFIPVWQMRKEPPGDWHIPLNQEHPQDS